MKTFQMFIGGGSVAAADGKSEKISSPATEEVLAEVPVEAARRQGPEGMATTPGRTASAATAR